MYGHDKPKTSLVNTCFNFLENYFTIKFSRKTYQNERLELFYKISWFNGRPLCVALVIQRKEYWHITHIATHENFRENGYALKLIKKIIKTAKKSNIDYVSCNVRCEDECSKNLFIKSGFEYIENPEKVQVKPGFMFYKYNLK